MSLKPSLITTSLALALGCSEVFAANLGALDLSSGSAGFSNTPIAGSFVDTLTFTGSNSAGVASYGGNFGVTPISPVPEPTSFVLMLAGASVVLFLARRRRS